MVSSLAQWFGELKNIASDTFSGIGDALAAGEIQAAWNIAMVGLKTGMLQATKSLKEYWYSFKQVFTQWTLDAIYGAQKFWANFVATVKGYWSGLANYSQSVGERIGHYLTKSSDPKLAADQEAAHNVVMDQIKAQGAAEQQRIAATKDAELSALEEQQRVAKGIAQDAFFGEMKGLDDDLAKAKKELEAARANARAARDKAAANIGAAPGFEAQKFDAAMIPSPAAIRKEIFGSFSGAALQAQGGAGSTQDKILEQLKKDAAEKNKQAARLLAAVREDGRIFA
jgi:hypothetical protein